MFSEKHIGRVSAILTIVIFNVLAQKQHGESCKDTSECVSKLSCLNNVCRCSSSERFAQDSCFSLDTFKVNIQKVRKDTTSLLLSWTTLQYGLEVVYTVSVTPPVTAASPFSVVSSQGGSVQGLSPGTQYTLNISSILDAYDLYPEHTVFVTYTTSTDQVHGGACNNFITCTDPLLCVNDFCNCSIGETFSEGSCNPNCPAGKYGFQCERACNATCGGDKSCDWIDGSCSQGCVAGYIGSFCEATCEAGKYGTGCSESCSVHCAGTNDLCDHVTGLCNQGCDPGYQQTKCTQKCDVGSYGDKCLSSCSTDCAGSDNACHHVTGDCDSCPPGRYRSNCAMSCPVNCGGPNNTCDRDTGFCDYGCDSGHWGQQCQNDCSEKCAGEDSACEQFGGVCINCDPGFYGNECQSRCSINCSGPSKACQQNSGRCESCPLGYYGDTCSNTCSTNCAETACDQDTGDCIRCPPGRYGTDCSSMCSVNCGGPNNICNIVTGNCLDGCDPGYRGARCNQQCATGTYGSRCQETCSEHCAGNRDSCNYVNGTCGLGCDPGFQGNLCLDKCDANKWGQDCLLLCNPSCENGCYHVNGHCACSPGYWGSSCQHECNNTTFGANCLEVCSGDCKNQLCHHVTGECASCPESKTGRFCASSQQGEEPGVSAVNIWIIVAPCAAAAVVIVVGILACRRFRLSKSRPPPKDYKIDPPTAANNDTEHTTYVNFSSRTPSSETTSKQKLEDYVNVLPNENHANPRPQSDNKFFNLPSQRGGTYANLPAHSDDKYKNLPAKSCQTDANLSSKHEPNYTNRTENQLQTSPKDHNNLSHNPAQVYKNLPQSSAENLSKLPKIGIQVPWLAKNFSKFKKEPPKTPKKPPEVAKKPSKLTQNYENIPSRMAVSSNPATSNHIDDNPYNN